MKNITRDFVSTIKKRFSESSPLIQIVMGPRQVGKTTGVHQYIKSLNKKQKYHLANADDQLSSSREWLLDQWSKAKQLGDGTLLIIDEVQKIENWSETIKKLWDDQKLQEIQIQVLLLGSSSLALTKGASESLAGRFEFIPVYHWDYVESNKLKKMDIDTFLKMGGYPKSYDFIDDEDRYLSYVRSSIIDRVIDKDILAFSNVKSPALFKQAFEIISCYPSQEISYRKLLGQLQDKGNTDLIKNYIDLFESAFLVKRIPKFSSREFKVKSSSPKIIPLASCLYYLFGASYDKETFVFEASVGAKLLQLSKDLYYWRKDNLEVDFVLNWRKQLYAIEVKSGRKRKTGGLEQFQKENPKAKVVFISKENYTSFIQSPDSFLLNYSL